MKTRTFAETLYLRLEKLARRKGTTMAKALRDAVAIGKWCEGEEEDTVRKP